MKKFQDLTGQRFGRLVALKRVEGKNGRKEWLCQCDCGAIKAITAGALTSGETKSCGCLQKELLSKRVKTHGKSNDRLYWVWRDMKLRCYVPSTNGYNRYGGEGKTVCKEWLDDFQSFYDWAVANGYDENKQSMQCTIERIDGNKGYSPENCRLATMKEQANNRRNNHFLEYKGKRQTMKQWAEETGIKYSTLKRRILAYHWSTEKALTTPIQKHKVGGKNEETKA